MSTQTQQTRVAVTISGSVKYTLSASVIDKGDLPSTRLFVMSIADATDPKADTYARVATIPDFGELKEDRDAALNTDSTLYRTSSVTLYYDDLTTADNAQTVLKERIDALVNDYNLYQTSFVATNETIIHPRIDKTIYDAAVKDYCSAVANTAAATATRDTKHTEYNDKVTECTRLNTRKTQASVVSADCTDSKGYFDLSSDSLTLLDGQGDYFVQQAQNYHAGKVDTPTPSALDNSFLAGINAFLAHLRASEAAKTQNTANAALFTAVCGSRSNESTTADNDVTTCNTELAQAKSAWDSAQAAVDTAAAAEAAALAAVQALDPSFTPASIDCNCLA